MHRAAVKNRNKNLQQEQGQIRNKNRLSAWLVSYELRNILGNPFIYMFGVFMPIFLAIVMSKVMTQEISDAQIVVQGITTIFLGMGTIIPLASMFIGYAAVYSQEIEKEIPLRMRLFGFSEKTTLKNRLAAEMCFLTAALVIYFVAGFLCLPVKPPAVSGILIYLLCLYLLAMVLFIMSHGIAGLVRKFGATFAITMILYFGMMICGGLMGVQYQMMPAGLRVVAGLLPITYITRDFYDVWIGETYRYAPLVQSYLFLAAISGILVYLSAMWQRRKG